jgi:hypothetical protein
MTVDQFEGFLHQRIDVRPGQKIRIEADRLIHFDVFSVRQFALYKQRMNCICDRFDLIEPTQDFECAPGSWDVVIPFQSGQIPRVTITVV